MSSIKQLFCIFSLSLLLVSCSSSIEGNYSYTGFSEDYDITLKSNGKYEWVLELQLDLPFNTGKKGDKIRGYGNWETNSDKSMIYLMNTGGDSSIEGTYKVKKGTFGNKFISLDGEKVLS